MADLFSSSVVLQQDFNGTAVTEQELPGRDCCFDLYYPANPGSPPPVVILVTGFPDYARKQETGKGLKDLPPYVSWGKLLAGEGIAAVIASCSDPEHDLATLIEHLGIGQIGLNLDMQRLAFWACSGNGPVALQLLSRNPSARAGVFLYSFLADLGDHDVVEKTLTFVNHLPVISSIEI